MSQSQTAIAPVSTVNPLLLPFLAIPNALPTITTAHDVDDDGDEYAVASHVCGDGSAVLLLSTAPDGLTLIDGTTLDIIGGPYATGEDAAVAAREVLTTPRD